MGTILSWVIVHRKKLLKAICGLAVGIFITFSINTCKENKKLSESLEMALNNIEAYLGSLEESLLANNVLLLTVDDLLDLNDKLVLLIDSVRDKLKIATKRLHSAATQTQIINVNGGMGVNGDIIQAIKDTVYSDTLKYNDLTSVYYTIGKDTVYIGLDIKNTQYIYLYTERLYKNKKSFIKRLLTFDFKKVNRFKYNILNTNDIIDTRDVRVIEIKE